jgi:hypothetical protein
MNFGRRTAEGERNCASVCADGQCIVNETDEDAGCFGAFGTTPDPAWPEQAASATTSDAAAARVAVCFMRSLIEWLPG